MTGHAPPRLVYALARPPHAAGLGLLAFALLAAGGLLLWAFTGAGPSPWPAVLGALLWGLASSVAWRCWRNWPGGRLEWDGRQWLLHEAHRSRPRLLATAPQVCWDGQGFLLLCAAVPSQGRRWLWLHAASAPALWGDLRGTVYWRGFVPFAPADKV